MVIITGESGCEKTTLLNMIGELEPVTSGILIVAGLEITKHNNLQTYYRYIVSFFSKLCAGRQKTVEENLKIGLKKGKTDVSIQEVLRSVGMEKVLKRNVYSLSGGE